MDVPIGFPSAVYRVVCLSFLLASGSCDDVTPPRIPKPPAKIVIVSGNAQTGTVAAELPAELSVRVVGEQGQPLAGQILNFRVVAGRGRVATGVAISDAEGLAAERWTLGTVSRDTQWVEVLWVDPVSGASTVFARIFAIGIADVPASLEKAAGDRQTLTVGGVAHDSLAVRARDRYGNPVPGASVKWTADHGSGTVSPTSSATDTNGIARSEWTAATSVRDTLKVAASIDTLRVTFIGGAMPAAATRLALLVPASGANAAAPFAVQPQLRLLDQYENVASVLEAEVTMTVSAGATPLGVTTVHPVAAGVFVFNNAGLTGPLGIYTLTYTATLNGTIMTASQEIELAAGAPHHYVVTANLDTVPVGGLVQLEARLEDGAGNQVRAAGRAVAWRVAGAQGAFESAVSMTDTLGIATTTLTVAQLFTADSARITASDSSVSGSARLAVRTEAAARLDFIPKPWNVPYGVHYIVSVEVQDMYRNRIRGDSRRVRLFVFGQDLLLDTLNADAVDGTATFDLRFDDPGPSYTLWAQADTLTSDWAQFPVLNVGIVLTSSEAITGLAVADSMVYTPVGAVSVNGVVSANPGPRPADFVGRYTTIAMNGVYAYLEHYHWVSVTLHDAGVVKTVNAATGAKGSYDVLECIPSPDLETDGTNYYMGCWGRKILPQIRRVGPTERFQTRIATLMTGNEPFALAGDKLYYYFAGTIRVLQMVNWQPAGNLSLIGDAGARYASGGARRLAVIDGMIYWSTTDSAGRVGAIQSAPATGGAATPVVTGLSTTVYGFRADSSWVYFIDAGVVKRFSRFGPSIVQTVIANEPVAEIAIDDRSLYWATGGFVKKMRKPD